MTYIHRMRMMIKPSLCGTGELCPLKHFSMCLLLASMPQLHTDASARRRASRQYQKVSVFASRRSKQNTCLRAWHMLLGLRRSAQRWMALSVCGNVVLAMLLVFKAEPGTTTFTCVPEPS